MAGRRSWTRMAPKIQRSFSPWPRNVFSRSPVNSRNGIRRCMPNWKSSIGKTRCSMRQQSLKEMNIRHEKKSQPGMTAVESLRSRPPLERMLRIHQALQSGAFPNASTLAREIEVATKTIHRDLEFMRDRLNLPLEFNPTRNGYHYTEEVSAFPTMQITEGELFALVVAEKALQQYRGTSFEKPLLSAIQKMER